MNFNYTIIEDVEDAILGIEKRMKPFSKWKNIGNCKEIKEAKNLILHKKPSLLFMDWSIKGGSTYEVLEIINNDINYNPYIIYFTGYQKEQPEIPMTVFNLYKVDKYLIKPIWKKLSLNLSQYLEEAEKKISSNKKIKLRDINHNIQIINPNNILCILVDNSVKRTKAIHLTNHRKIVIKQTFNKLENLLNESSIDYFYANKRNSIVVKSHITKVEKDYIIFGENFPKVKISKENLNNLFDWLFN